MDQHAVLEARVVSLLLELKAAEDTIAGMPGEAAAVARGRLAARFAECKEPLAALRIRLANGAGGPADLMNWESYWQRQKECSQLFTECLPLLQGLALRVLGWDDGLCRIADRLVSNLAERAGLGWDRITLPGEGEQFRLLPQAIWIRYPAPSVWDLPITAHELGHFLGPRLEKEQGDTTMRPLQDLLDQEKDPAARKFLREELSDVFATYTLGPAYACACLLVRFDPDKAHIDRDEHPSAAKRSYAILEALRRLDGGKSGIFSGIAGTLRNTWNATLTLFGQETSLKDQLGEAQFQALDQQVVLLYKKVDERLMSMRYGITDLQRGQELAAHLAGQADLPAPARYSIADVLNAAWLARAADMDQGSHNTAHLGRRGLEMCQLLAP